MESGGTEILPLNLCSTNRRKAFGTMRNGAEVQGHLTAAIRNNNNNIKNQGTRLSVQQKETDTPGSKVNGTGLKSAGLDESGIGIHCSDEEDGSINSRGEDSKDETDPSSPATESMDGDSSVSPENMSEFSEKMAITQEPTLIVNGLDIYYKCKLCFKVFSTEQRWKRHKQDTHFNPRLHVCPICGERFKRSTHLKRHRDRRHVPHAMTPVVPAAQTDKRRFSCPQCPRVFERANKLLAHIQQYHQNKRPFRCTTCNEGFKRQDHLNRHRESKSHKLRVVLANKPEYGDDVINCGDVPKEMMQSFASHTGIKPQTLFSLVESAKLQGSTEDDCQSNVSADLKTSEDMMVVQVNTPSSSVKSVALDFSMGEVTPPPETAKSDTSADNSVSPVPMEESYNQYLSNSVNEALATASPEPEDLGTSWGQDGAVTCVLCGKVFDSEKRMKIHLRQTHSTERRHVCRLCGERFKRSTHLRRHMNSNKHQRLSQAAGHGKVYGSLDDLEDEDSTHMNGAYSRLSRGKHRFPKGHYLDDYDDIPISMVPRSHPLQQLPRLDADEEPNGYVAMETEATEAETVIASGSKASSISHNQEEGIREGQSAIPNSYFRSSELISLLDRKRVYPIKQHISQPIKRSVHSFDLDSVSVIKVESENCDLKSSQQESSLRGRTPNNPEATGTDFIMDHPRSTLRSLLQNSTLSYHRSKDSGKQRASGIHGTGLSRGEADLAQYVADMSHKYSLKPWQCVICQQFFESQSYVLTHIRNFHPDVRPYPCDLCERTYMTQQDLEKHFTHVHAMEARDESHWGNHDNKPKPVNRRKKTMPRKVLYNVEADNGDLGLNDSDLENNLEDDLDIDLTEIMSRANGGSRSPTLTLGDTDTEDEVESMLFVKKNTVVNRNNFECRICQKVFSARPNVHTHIRQIHQNVRPFTCDFCGENFKRGTHLRIHISRKHHDSVRDEDIRLVDQNREDRSEVLVVYPKPSQLLHNSILRNSSGIWKCSRCPKTFPKKDLYQHHLKLHLAAENCACPFCDKVFSHEKILRQHLRSHEDEPRYICTLCNVSFLLQSAYESHIREHSEFNMDDSDDGYYDNSLPVIVAKPAAINKSMNLSNRKRDQVEISMDEKPDVELDQNGISDNKVKEVIINLETVCAVCNEEFDDMDSLRAHTRAHKKPYRCQYCSKKYDNISYLERHTRVHTGSKPYVCSVCNRGFPRKERAEEHIVKYH